MPTVSPTFNQPQPGVSSSAAGRTANIAPSPLPAAASAPPARMPDPPSATVTLSPQALSALAAGDPTASAHPIAPGPHAASAYESLKSGISTAAHDVGDAVADGAHAVVEGVEATLSTANKVAKGALELPFALVAQGCDAVGGLIDEL
jgi:hypothetical protein